MPRPVPQIPQPGQESVWAYPRPPRVERTAKRIEIWLGGTRIAETSGAFRVLETSHPPTYYLPRTAFETGVLSPAPGASVCEWKGQASYWTLSSGSKTAVAAGWSYEHPHPDFQDIAGHIAVYAGYMDECRVAGERVTPQPGGFYGGWITAEVVGPFKGEPGSLGW
ncbi:hypothetical protein GCM10008955_27080 [Deinococcus malanensis]|uniref:DUF427 domain-containing protein n=1 Tax=Deinococcus malanensis TaxID=1706855 RepID=A0ABQ2EYF4_9DEIO|nr:DUF427 domain-containing protein [Deinococcus malanensis]GGK31788.1 hypothetical protein GCM10008955_27080 [Deinococcus malanensis]